MQSPYLRAIVIFVGGRSNPPKVAGGADLRRFFTALAHTHGLLAQAPHSP